MTLAPLALTMGEPAGIGPDVTIDVWRRRRDFNLPPFYAWPIPNCSSGGLR